MKKSLTKRESLTITSMLFGMFFGAGNLIFPAMVGLQAGRNFWSAFAGIFVTAVGIPMLAVIALGISRSNGVLALAGRVSPRYSLFFTTVLYLTIGPLFAIPRCASTSFAVGAVNLLPSGNRALYQAAFSLLFFAAVLLISLDSGKIMTWVGRILTPAFLVFLAVLVIAALRNPVSSISAGDPAPAYEHGAFVKGFLEGYNTLDALAGLAFGIVVIEAVQSYGVREPEHVAVCTGKAGVFSCLFMGVIYFFITLVCAQSAPICAQCPDGGAVLGTIAGHYFHSVGDVLMTAIVTLACLKTAVGLTVSCSEAFVQMFPGRIGYRSWVVLFSTVSFIVANFGLSTIVAWCVPVLMFLYPLSITLILMGIFSRFFGHSRQVYTWTTGLTLIAAAFDMLGAIAGMVPDSSILAAISGFAARCIPLYRYGLGWMCPACIGFVVGLLSLRRSRRVKSANSR